MFLLGFATHGIVSNGEISDLQNSEHDGPGWQPMIHFLELLPALIDLNACGDVQCSVLKFKTW